VDYNRFMEIFRKRKARTARATQTGTNQNIPGQ